MGSIILNRFDSCERGDECASLRDSTRKTRYSQRINQVTGQEKTNIHRRTKNRKSNIVKKEPTHRETEMEEAVIAPR
jgi:hypothetical protein